jgi:DNA mismatch endonuclease (patch repair protein)
MTNHVSPKQRSRNMAAVHSFDTTPERAVRSILHRLGLRFRLHQKSLPGTPDIVLKRHTTVVFVNGCFWHAHGCSRGKPPATRREFWLPKLRRNQERDRNDVARLHALGWRVLTVWECELRDQAQLELRLVKAFDRDRYRRGASCVGRKRRTQEQSQVQFVPSILC